MITQPRTLVHNLISLPADKTADDDVAERHDIVLLFDASKANPNGDPDTGNMPRLQPDTLRGLVTDVCLKRKVRNFFSLYNPNGEPRGESPAQPGYTIFIRENAILKDTLNSDAVKAEASRLFNESLEKKPEEVRTRAVDLLEGDAFELRPKKKGLNEANKKLAKVLVKELTEDKDRALRDSLCSLYMDNRWFGAVASTEGPLKGSFYGQIRGPLQFSFAESLDRILQLDATITRCAVASEKPGSDGGASEETGNRTMGRKHLVDYGLYRTHIYFSPAFAAKTHFAYYDLDNFFFALIHMFRDDNAAGRTGMRVVGLVDFQHASSLGNEHAHKLFELVKVERTTESKKRNPDFPDSLDHYFGSAPEGNVREVSENGQTQARVTARKLIWEIPPAGSAENG